LKAPQPEIVLKASLTLTSEVASSAEILARNLSTASKQENSEVKAGPPSMLTLNSDVLDRSLTAHGKASLIFIVLDARKHFKCSIFVNFPHVTVHSILFYTSVAKVLEYQILLLLG
jgi:hypothetical protein